MHPRAYIMYRIDICMCMYVYIYIFILRVYVCNKLLGEKEIQRERERETLQSLLKFRRCIRCSFGTGSSLTLE